MMLDGSQKRIGSVEIGDQLKTLTASGHLIDTPVVMIMDTSSEPGISFLAI